MKYTIEGGNLPAAVIQLDPGESLVSQVGGRTWMRGNVTTETKAEGGLGKSLGRVLTGESLFMSTYTAQSAAEIAFTSSFPGRILARVLQPGESIICQKTAFLCASYGVTLSVFLQKKIGAGLFGGEGFIMQKITGPGIVFLEISGYSPEYVLQPGEKIVCDTGVVAAMDETCTLDIQMVKGVKNMLLGGEGLVDTVITGPGKVYLQTMTIPKLAQLITPHLKIKK